MLKPKQLLAWQLASTLSHAGRIWHPDEQEIDEKTGSRVKPGMTGGNSVRCYAN